MSGRGRAAQAPQTAFTAATACSGHVGATVNFCVLPSDGLCPHPTRKEHQAVTVEIPPQHVRETASQLGDGVPYALKVLAGRLAGSARPPSM